MPFVSLLINMESTPKKSGLYKNKFYITLKMAKKKMSWQKKKCFCQSKNMVWFHLKPN